MKNHLSSLLLVCFGSTTVLNLAQAQTADWNVTSGNWSTSTNWSPNSVPNSVGANAQMTSATNRNATLDLNVTVGQIRNRIDRNWTIANGGASTITLDNTGTSNALIGRTDNRNSAGTFTLGTVANPINLFLSDGLTIQQRSGNANFGSRIDGVVVNGNIANTVGDTGTKNIDIFMGALNEANGENNTRINGNINSIGSILIRGNTSSAQTGDVFLNGQIGANITTLTLNDTNRSNVTLSGSTSNLFTGVTTVSRGRLTLNKSGGALAISGDIVLGDGTVVGAGITRDEILLQGAEQISNSSDLTLASSGEFRLNDHAETLDQLSAVTGSLLATLNTGTLTVNSFLFDGILQAPGVYNSSNFASFITGSGTLTVVPEPSVTALTLFAALALMWRRNQKRIR